MSDVTNFTCQDCGENGVATCDESGGMPINHDVSINGEINLTDCIRGNDNARVYGIRLTRSPSGIYDYTIYVDGVGPDGFGSGSLYLDFTDKTGDTYSLSLYSSTRKTHSVSYNSDNPNIQGIKWHN